MSSSLPLPLPLPSSKFGAPKSPIISASPELENFRAALKTSDFSSCSSILRLTIGEKLKVEEEDKLMVSQRSGDGWLNTNIKVAICLL